LTGQQNHQIHSFTDIKPSIKTNSKIKGYKTQAKEYFLKGSLTKVWQHYLGTNPGDSWNGKKVSFGMLFSKKDKKIVCNDESISQIDTGQIVYLKSKTIKMNCKPGYCF